MDQLRTFFTLAPIERVIQSERRSIFCNFSHRFCIKIVGRSEEPKLRPCELGVFSESLIPENTMVMFYGGIVISFQETQDLPHWRKTYLRYSNGNGFDGWFAALILHDAVETMSLNVDDQLKMSIENRTKILPLIE